MANQTTIKFRLTEEQKKEWKSLCDKENITLSKLILASVENKLLDSDRRKITSFLEEQGNIFTRIQNNINQVAKQANTSKSVDIETLKKFNKQLKVIENLKKEQNEIFLNIINILA